MGGEGDTSSDLMVGVTAELEALEAVAKRLQTSGFTRPVTIIGQVSRSTAEAHARNASLADGGRLMSFEPCSLFLLFFPPNFPHFQIIWC